MQEKGQKCKNSDANLYTKKQPVLGCVFEIFYLFPIQKSQTGITKFLLNFLISNVLFPYNHQMNRLTFTLLTHSLYGAIHCTKYINKKEPTTGSFLMAGLTRLELATSCVTGRHSNQLSYNPKLFNFQLRYHLSNHVRSLIIKC